ncbi:MAG: DUF4878 domain-containing protein [Chitinophagaceae bacterium]|nr:DUF4878 domain-containing protein [Chitinophagaceae bacterium]
MKKLILFAAILSFTVMGCKTGGGGDPKSVLMSFFDALNNKDLTTAKKYTTKESDQMLQMMEAQMKMMPDSLKDKKYDKNNVEFGDATITGDKATVPVKDKTSGETTNFTLKKEGTDWKVAFDKATIMEMAQDKMKAHGMDTNGGMDSAHKMMDNLNKMSDSLGNMKTDSAR